MGNNAVNLLRDISNCEVFDLGSELNDSKWDGMYSFLFDQSIVNKYAHEQFIENADVYHTKYTHHDHFYNLIQSTLTKIRSNELFRNNQANHLDLDNLAILDIGSGSGNSIFPLLKIFPQAHIIASDISLQLLYLLKAAANQLNVANNLVVAQLNAEELNFKENSFDLVIGASILHHLYSPNKTIEGCSRVLKRDGYAIFYEPFEIGNMMIRSIFSELLRDHRSSTLPDHLVKFFEAIIKDYEFRKGRDKSNHLFQYVDDKWLFTTKYFEEMATKYGFSDYTTYSLHQPDDLFDKQIEVLLKLGLGSNPDVLPEWGWQIIREYSNQFSDDVKNELIIEGCVVFKK